MNKLRLLAGLLCIAAFSHAQSPVLSEAPGATNEKQADEGPNLKKFEHFYVGFGLVDAIKDDYADIAFGKSNELVLGQRFKRKVNNWYSVGTESEFTVTNFHVNLDSTLNANVAKEVLRMNQLGFALYNRFNFGKRGNRIGNFFQLGVYGQWVMNSKVVLHQDATNAKELRSKLVNPDYVNRWNYGVNASIGFNRVLLTARYRLSDLVDESKSPYQGIPPIVFGIQIGIHK